MTDHADVSGLSGDRGPSWAEPGLYKLPFKLHGDYRPCVAVDEHGYMAGCYFLPEDGDEGRARSILTLMLDEHDDEERFLRLME